MRSVNPIRLTALALCLTTLHASSESVRLQFLGHSGWLISRGDVSVLVDPVGISAEGRVDAARPPSVPPAGLDLLVVTHGHADHFAQAYVRSAIDAGIRVAVGHDIDTVPAATRLAPRASVEVGGVTLTTIQSTDAGVGVVLEIAGTKIYHSGDHALWTDDLKAAYQAEIDWLARTVGSVDIVMVAIATGRSCEVRPSLLDGATYAAQRLNALWVIPMHLQCLDRLPGAAATLRSALNPVSASVMVPQRIGDTLVYPSSPR